MTFQKEMEIIVAALCLSHKCTVAIAPSLVFQGRNQNVGFCNLHAEDGNKISEPKGGQSFDNRTVSPHGRKIVAAAGLRVKFRGERRCWRSHGVRVPRGGKCCKRVLGRPLGLARGGVTAPMVFWWSMSV